MQITVQTVAEHVGARLLGDGGVQLTGIASVQSAQAGDLVFVEDEANFELAALSSASAVLAGEFAAAKTSSKPLLLVARPKLAFSRAARLFAAKPQPPAEVHPSAVVHPSAGIANHVHVAARVVIAAGVEIAAGTRIGAGSVIGEKVRIGKDCEIYPNVTIYPGTHLGDRVMVHAGAVLGSDGFGYVRDSKSGRYEKFPQIGRLEIEDDVEIGANTTIDRGALEVTRIGRGAKIDNLVHIGHNCQIGENVVIAAQTGLSGSIVIENGAVLGGQVGIGEHAHLGEGVMLGGQAGVLPKKVLRGKGVAFWGTPAKPLREYLKELATLSRLAKKK
ncbi:MAG: UDP-3-O-(3-hydroxymyristoyl)glucosamine N-acyltransferase [Acidobacteria bacterium]|nr:UDP-3-O-(3-hydroxymyristoyl)glucosamine N-acyltransferase [Acidobacteriota bacterium]